jgi:hypothetical protein
MQVANGLYKFNNKIGLTHFELVPIYGKGTFIMFVAINNHLNPGQR